MNDLLLKILWWMIPISILCTIMGVSVYVLTKRKNDTND